MYKQMSLLTLMNKVIQWDQAFVDSIQYSHKYSVSVATFDDTKYIREGIHL